MAKRVRRMAKRSKRKPRMKPMLVDSQALRQLQVYRYPFSVSTSNPKIPDGKLTQSIGWKINSTGTTVGAQILFLICPGFDHQVIIADAATTSERGWNLAYVSQPAANRIQIFRDVLKYRYVSKAIKLRCISGDDDNDGYWEAVRIPISNNDKNFNIAKAVDAAFTSRPLRIRPAFKNQLFAKENWLLNPTYQSGKIKDLGQYEFRLSPEKEEHDMIDVPRSVEFLAANYDADGEILTDGIDEQHKWKWLMDNQWDMIAIKIQGINATNILWHVATNLEYQPQESSTINQYQTECVDAGYSLKQRQLEYKYKERMPGRYVGGPRNS